MCMYNCLGVCPVPKKATEDVRSPGVGVYQVVNHTTWGLGTELGSLGRQGQAETGVLLTTEPFLQLPGFEVLT